MSVVEEEDRTPEKSAVEGSVPDKLKRDRAVDFSIERILGPDFGGGRTSGSREEEGEEERDVPVWIHCSRFSARPTAGPRRRAQGVCEASPRPSHPRCRTSFSGHQVSRLRSEFVRGAYLSEAGRCRTLAEELGLSEAQVKIWFQNARAKRRRSEGGRKSPLAKRLAEAGLYNHSAAEPTPS